MSNRHVTKEELDELTVSLNQALQEAVTKLNELGHRYNTLTAQVGLLATKLEQFQQLVATPPTRGEIVSMMESEGVPWAEAEQMVIQMKGKG